MRERHGLTLIEVILLLVILGVLAALIIPNLMASGRASNERSSSSSLKTLASAEADFRGNDRDGNRVQDFWTRDVAGLYGVVPVGSTEMIKLIEISVAGADFAAAGAAPLGVTGLEEVDRKHYATAAAKQGYWYQRMLADESTGTRVPYLTNTGGIESTDGTPNLKTWWHSTRFGFYAFPDHAETRREVFFINEGNTIFKRLTHGPVKSPSQLPSPAGIVLRVAQDALSGTQPAEAWPADAVLKAEYRKLD